MDTRHGWVAPRALAPRHSAAIERRRFRAVGLERAGAVERRRPTAMGARAATLATIAALALAGCTSNSTNGAASIAVAIADDTCTLSAAQAPAGHAVFTLKNTGSKVAEFYVYAADGTTIIAELENVGPGITRDLVVALDEGTYVTSCDPGMDGSPIRSDFVATAAGRTESPSAERQAALDAASTQFLAFVRAEANSLATKTKAFADAFAAGDDATARSLYADTRVHWERLEPVAESFGDLDPSLDLREADLGPQELWMGWHRAEKVLWPPTDGYAITEADRASIAAQLVADTLDLKSRVTDPAFTIAPFAIGNGAKELLDELATSKITGEEEVWSGTDLWDMQGNVDGAYAAYESLRPIVAASDPALATELDQRFGDVNAILATHGSLAKGFVPYSALTHADVLELSRAVEALSEPLSRLTAAAVL